MKRLLSLFIITVFFTSFFSSAFAQELGTLDDSQQSNKTVVLGFSDVTRTHPYYTAITFLNEEGVIGGYADGTFKPEKTINRAEVLKIILGSIGTTAQDAFKPYFPDVLESDWFAPYIIHAKEMGLVKGNELDGTFTPGRQVNLAEFLKMLLTANEIDLAPFKGKAAATNYSPDDWFSPYLNYAIAFGIVILDDQDRINPSEQLTRGDVVHMMYLLTLIRRGSDTQFLLGRAEADMAQIEVYIAANQVGDAKRSSELAVDLTQQALKNMPTNNVVLGAAKLARAYDYLVTSFIEGIQKNYSGAADFANQAIDKATEAWEANSATQPIAKHIKERAREILAQVGGEEK